MIDLTNEEIKERVDAYPRIIEAMDQIMNQCIGYMCMGFEMDANSIGQSIFYATGMNAEELHEESKRLLSKTSE